jgi:hypothetical protein
MARQAGYPSAQFDLARDLATATITATATATPRPTAPATASATSTATATAPQTAAPTATSTPTIALSYGREKRFVIHADEKLAAFLELELALTRPAVGAQP